MIQPQELRLGNYVNLNDGLGQDEFRQVSGIDHKIIYTLIKGCRFSQVHQKFERVYPIPLTEDILVKCGFTLTKDKAVWKTDSCGLHLMDIAGKYYRANYPIKADIEHLHQLQNLYFALTGKELEVKS